MNKYYPFKVWVTALMLTAISMVAIVSYREKWDWSNELILLLIYFFGMGVVISIPTFLIFFVVYKRMKEKTMTQKLLLSSIAIAGITLSLFLIMGKDIFLFNNAGIALPVTFAFSITTAIFVFK
ncbi:MAG TPA: hypothetical protein VF622_06455 [Segetibacter sp.]|jgi:hypothetical protein